MSDQTMRVEKAQVVRAGTKPESQSLSSTMRLEAQDIVRAAAGPRPQAQGRAGTVRADGPVVRASTAATGFSVVRAGSLAQKPVNLNGRDYAVTRVISQGKTGEADIFLVEHGGAQLVLKRYRHDLVPKLEVLEQLKRLEHPNLIRLVDYGSADGCFCELMELACGETLDKHLPIREPSAFESVVRELVAGCKACHDLGIVHRDIKPSNIFCRNADGTGLMIADFGISSFLDEGQNRKVTMQRLTVDYAAPETFGVVLPGEEARVVVGPAADYYSLGLTLLEVWTGRPVFEQSLGAFAISDLIRAGNVPVPDEVPPRVRDLVRGLTVVNHLRRWGYDEVRRWLAGEQVEVFAESVSRRSFERFDFVKVAGQVKSAGSPTEMAALMREHPEQGQRHLYRGEIAAWALEADRLLASALRDVVEEELPGDKELGLFKATCLLDPRQPFVTRGGVACPVHEDFEQTLREIGDALEAERDHYLPELTGKPHPRLFVYLEALGQQEYLAELRRCLKGCSPEKGFERIVLLLQGRDALKVGGVLLRSFADLQAASAEIQQSLAAQLHRADSKFLVWLEEMGLKSDSRPISDCGVDELVELVRGMPWLKRRDKALIERLNRSDEAGWTDLMRAAREGRVEVCRELIASGAAVDTPSRSAETALQIAALAGQGEVMRLLLEAGANPEPRDATARPLIHRVVELCEDGNVEPLRLLLEAKASPDVQQPDDGWTPLLLAVSLGLHDAARLLLERGADPNFRDPSREGTKVDMPALFTAAGDDDPAMIDLLVSGRADPNARDSEGWTPLHYAALHGRAEAVKALCRHGASLLAEEKDGWLPLHLAASHGRAEVAPMLLTPSTLDRPTKDGLTPLALAAANGHAAVVRLLASNGADLRLADRDGWGPLRHAVNAGRTECVAALLQAGVTADAEPGEDGWRPLRDAVVDRKDPQLVLMLLSAGARPDTICGRDEWTVLHQAVQSGELEIARALLEAGAKPDPRETEDGWTPLFYAVGRANLEMVRLLLDHKADPNTQDGSGRTCLHCPGEDDKHYDLKILELLLERGGDGGIGEHEKGHTPVHYAIFDKQHGALGLYVKHRSGLEKPDKLGYTPLMLAAANGKLKMVRKLLEAGVSRGHRSTEGETAMDIALRNEHTKVLQLLASGENLAAKAKLARVGGAGASALRALAIALFGYGFVFLAHRRDLFGGLLDSAGSQTAGAAALSHLMVWYFLLLGVERTAGYMEAPRHEGLLHRFARLLVRPALPGLLILGAVAGLEALANLPDVAALLARVPVGALFETHLLRSALGGMLPSDGYALGASLVILAALAPPARLLGRGRRALEYAEALEDE